MAFLLERRWGTAMHNFLPIAYFENQFIPFGDPNQVLLFRLDRHCDRLSASARFINYDLPASKIQSVIVDFVKKNQPTTSFYIRPFVYTSDLGIAPRLHNIEHNFFVYGLELGDYLSPDGVSCRLSSWYRQEDRSLPLRGKISGAYITSSLAKTEAVTSGFDEAILMNSQGKVSEASGMNIFIVRQGKLITPGFEQDILEGITRDSILTLARNLGIPVVERPVDKTELLIADEVFLSGTAAKITPVRQIENYQLSTNRPITHQLREKLSAITENRDPEYPDWVFAIPV
jgi:branched-chain amino acid aminotransferase